MPKYQEIGGEVYVEGGPVCDWCKDGTRKRYSFANILGKTYEDQCRELHLDPNDVIPCPSCQGTSVKRLSKWTADQLTEWLARAGFEFSEIDCLNATKEFTEWGITGFVTGGQIGACEKGFTNTLRALVAAIAKRGN